MMNYNVQIAFWVVVTLIIGSLIWNRFFMSYLKKSGINKSNRGTAGKEMVLNLLKPAIFLKSLSVMCSILLINSDDNISDALNYIKPAKCLDNLLEKINE